MHAEVLKKTGHVRPVPWRPPQLLKSEVENPPIASCSLIDPPMYQSVLLYHSPCLANVYIGRGEGVVVRKHTVL